MLSGKHVKDWIVRTLRMGNITTEEEAIEGDILNHCTCCVCPRPLRLFGYPGEAGRPAPICSLCKWKKSNPEVVNLLVWRISYEGFPVCIMQHVARFLCQEGDGLSITRCATVARITSPHIKCILATARMRKWKSFLQGGSRQLSRFVHRELHDYDVPRVRMLHGAYIGFVLRQAKVTSSIWPFALAFHYPRGNATRMIAGRPLQIIVSFLAGVHDAKESKGITL